MVVAVSLTACDPPAGQHQRRDAIVGGVAAPELTSVFFIDNDAGVCSATLIAPHTLITAAHCVESVPMFASNPPKVSDLDGGLYVVTRRLTYAQATDGGTADLALLLLDRPPGVAVMPWAWWGPAPVEDTPVRLAGYGHTESGNARERRAVATTVRGAVENRTWGLVLVTGDFGKGLCFGDSGGPTLSSSVDGGERLIAVNSFITATCGAGASSSVLLFPYRRFIEGWLATHEAATCARDGRCLAGCLPEDPDCRCGLDGTCRPECPEGDDLDCPGTCQLDGVCAERAECPGGDRDCIADGQPCVNAGQCAGRRCVNDPQNQTKYCSAACGPAVPCVSGMTCDAARALCMVAQLPVVAEGSACDETVKCLSGTVCAEAAPSQRRCLRTCTSQAQCLAGSRCRFGSVPVCAPDPPLTLDAGLEWQGPLAPLGCSATGWPGLWLVVVTLRRARRLR